MLRWKSLLLELLSFFFLVFFRLFNPIVSLLIRVLVLSRFRACARSAVPVSTQFDGFSRVVGSGNLLIGEYCRFGRNVLFETNGRARIVVGNRVRINDGSILAAHSGICIGDDCLIGEYVSIRDANHGFGSSGLIRLLPHTSAAVVIGRDVWIGRGVCILKGVSIGDGAIVGANSVVTKDVFPGTIVAGSPAKPIGLRGADK